MFSTVFLPREPFYTLVKNPPFPIQLSFCLDRDFCLSTLERALTTMSTGKVCSVCSQTLVKSSFSAGQWKKNCSTRKCSSCILGGGTTQQADSGASLSRQKTDSLFLKSICLCSAFSLLFHVRRFCADFQRPRSLSLF